MWTPVPNGKEIVVLAFFIAQMPKGFEDILERRNRKWDVHEKEKCITGIEAESKERRRQEAIIAVHEKFGKNAMLKGTSLQEKATARERNNQIGGHRA